MVEPNMEGGVNSPVKKSTLFVICIRWIGRMSSLNDESDTFESDESVERPRGIRDIFCPSMEILSYPRALRTVSRCPPCLGI